MRKALDLYLIPKRRGGNTLRSPRESIHAIETEDGDRVRQMIEWLSRRKNRVVAWLGRVLRKAHDYYVRLEDRIDPVERVLKAMASRHSFVVYTGNPEEFPRILKRQRSKHIFWFSVDLVFSGVVLVFTPFLAPIPGPNIFFYYPFLRLLSHYRAILGATSGLRSSDIEFKSLPELRGLEDNLSRSTRFIQQRGGTGQSAIKEAGERRTDSGLAGGPDAKQQRGGTGQSAIKEAAERRTDSGLAGGPDAN
ncbi:MAG: hypothetical protein HYU27_00595 [Acidobacteria bacterium]|nr:hypothetical protein [Acidobacteriota bacterium]